MQNFKRLAALLLLSVSGCATTVPVPVSCPPPAPLPLALTESPSTGPSLMERYEASLRKLESLLQKATRPE